MKIVDATIAVAALVGVLSLVGCGAFDASKSGAGALPTTIRLATEIPLGDASSDEVEVFAREIEERSAGSITVDIRWQSFLGDEAGNPLAWTAYRGDPFTEVARQAQAGEVHLAMVPDFAWIELGAHSVAALKVPFLIDSVTLMKEVARRQGDQALAQLHGLGVTPLALLPGSIRHPVGFDHPLTSPRDFADQGIRFFDVAAKPLIEAWGGRAMDLAGTFGAAVMDGHVQGADSAFVHSMDLPRAGVFTGDVSHLATFNTLVASSAWWARLSPSQQEVVHAAAAAALDHSVETTRDDATAGRVYCGQGGTIVHAGDAQVQALKQLVQPTVDALREHPDTREVVRAIEGLKAALPPAVIAAECAPAPPPDRRGDPAETAAFPEGSFRAELTVEDFTDRGVDLVTARNHAEVWTLTFRDGQVWDIHCPGSTYSVSNGRVVVVLGRGDPGCGEIPGGELFSARWTFDGSVLRFSEIGPGIGGPPLQAFSEALWGSQDWVKID